MKMMMEAKKHVDALKMLAEKEGLELNDLISQCCEEEGEEEEGGEMESEGMGMDKEERPMPDKGKIALIIAKMKNGQKE